MFKNFFIEMNDTIFQISISFNTRSIKAFEEFFFPKDDVTEKMTSEGKTYVFKTQENFCTFLKKLKALKIRLEDIYEIGYPKDNYTDIFISKFRIRSEADSEAPQIIKEFEEIEKELAFQDAKRKKLKQIKNVGKVSLVGATFAEDCGYDDCYFMPQGNDNIEISLVGKSVIFPKRVLTLFEQGKVDAENFERAILLNCWLPLIFTDLSYDEVRLFGNHAVLKNNKNLTATSFELKAKGSLESAEVSSSLDDFAKRNAEICKSSLDFDFLNDPSLSLENYTLYIPSFVEKLRGYDAVKKCSKKIIWG